MRGEKEGRGVRERGDWEERREGILHRKMSPHLCKKKECIRKSPLCHHQWVTLLGITLNTVNVVKEKGGRTVYIKGENTDKERQCVIFVLTLD